ncbi:MAG: XRE family transcriptional regulator [Actinomycetota bacterium]|nr:XRE family transcriptional regulator [Actinomycetota bacterium]
MSTGRDTVDREPNRLLSAARRARRLTQQQLAEAVGAAHWGLFERESALDADHVSKLERGLITWPNQRYREAFRAVLGAATDAELGFYHRHPADTVELTDGGREVHGVRRNEFLCLVSRLGAGAGLGVGAALSDPVREVLSLAEAPAVPGRVGRSEVEQVRYATETFRSWRGRYGGGACRDALAGQVRWAAGLLGGRAENSIRRELHSAVGSLADMAGWGDVDAGHHETALRYFRLALHCAEKSGDWTLRAEVLTDMSQQTVDRGQLDDALTLIEMAQVRADRVVGTGRAMMSCDHARILGVAGRVDDCRGAVAAAEDYFADHQPTVDCFGSSYFRQASETYLTLDNGHALFYPALRDPAAARAAVEQLRAALGHPDAVERYRRAMGTAKLATLEVLHGDRDEGVALAHRALDLGDGVRSVRLADDLRLLRGATSRHAGEPVQVLQQRLDLVLMSA